MRTWAWSLLSGISIFFAIGNVGKAQNFFEQKRKNIENLQGKAEEYANKVLETSEKAVQSIGKKAKKWQQDAIKGMGRQDNIRYKIPGFPDGTKAAVPEDGTPTYEFRCLYENRCLHLDIDDADNVYAQLKSQGGKNQRWRVRHAPIPDHPLAVEIISVENGEPLDMRVDGNFNVYTHPAHSGSNQRFLIIPKTGNLVFVVSCHSLGRTLTTEKEGIRNVAMHTNGGESNQLWLMILR